MQMATYFYVVITKAKPGEEEAFHKWYDAEHLPDCVMVPGIRSARRFRLLNDAPDKGLLQGYDSLALYEMETDDPAAVGRELSARAGTDAMPLTDALDLTDSLKIFAKPAGQSEARS
jgi:hypothetical protein